MMTIPIVELGEFTSVLSSRSAKVSSQTDCTTLQLGNIILFTQMWNLLMHLHPISHLKYSKCNTVKEV